MSPHRSLRLPSLQIAALALSTFFPVLSRAQYAPQAPAPPQDYGQYAPDEEPGYTQPDQQAYRPNDPNASGYPDQQYDNSQPNPYNAPPAAAPMQSQAPMNTEQLEQLVAPIALYPDSLVAQILAAATYPAQIVDADHWRQSMGNAPPDQVVAGANAQNWDPSIKALAAVPQLLVQMDQNIRWTIALGNAYYNQPQQVLDVIQVMRQRAQSAGNLQSGPQEEVTSDEGYIQIAPANPDLMYVPVYNPWAVYGEPVAPYRGFSFVSALGGFFSSGFGYDAIRWGSGIAMGAFLHSPFGLLSWGLDWLAHSLLFHNSCYYSHSTSLVDWGLPHGGPRVPYYRGIYNRAGYHAPGFRGPGYRGPGYREPVFHGGMHPENAGGYRSPAFGSHPGYGFNTAREQANARQGFPNRDGLGGREPYTHSDPRYGFNNQQRNSYPGQQAWNRAPQFTHPEQNRSQGFGQRSPYPGNSLNRSYQGGYPRMDSVRPGFGNTQAYRGPSPSYGRDAFNNSRPGNYGGFSNPGFGGRGFSNNFSKPERSGGSHFFGGGGGFKEPQAPKMDRSFGGGGHFGGGGSHFGGGHSGGGGHSSGHHR